MESSSSSTTTNEKNNSQLVNPQFFPGHKSKPNGQIAVISGGTQGIGYQVAERMLQGGFDVLLFGSSSKKKLLESVNRLQSAYSEQEVRGVSYDLSRIESESFFSAALDEALLTYPPNRKLTVVVCGAGVLEMKPAVSLTLSEIEKVLSINLTATMLLAQNALRHMDPKQHGAVVILSSISGISPPLPGLSMYNATKAAQLAYARSLLMELRATQIRVSCICPGLVQTEIARNVLDGQELMLVSDAQQYPIQMSSKTVAETVFYCATGGGKAVIAEIVLLPICDMHRFQQIRLNHILPKELPPVLDFNSEPELTVGTGHRHHPHHHLNIGTGHHPQPHHVKIGTAHHHHHHHHHPPPPIAIVSGGSRGIGFGIAKSLAESGWRVALVAKSQERLTKAVNLLPQGSAIGIAIDLANRTSFPHLKEQVVEETLKRFGSSNLKAVIPCAGINRRKHSAVASPDVWDQVMSLNLIGSMYLTSYCIPYLIRTKGNIVFLGSTAMHYPLSSDAGLAPYFTSKFGLSGFANSIRTDLGPFGVKVALLSAEMTNTDLGRAPGPASWATPSSEWIQVEDCAEAVQFVLSVQDAHVAQIYLYPQTHNHIPSSLAAKHFLEKTFLHSKL